jgi:hypothetical protein
LAAERHGIKLEICIWICSMLESRKIITTLSEETLRAFVVKGCLQGGVVSPLLWSLVVDDLLWELNNDGHYMVEYADVIEILINGIFLQMVSEVLQTSLCTVWRWCDRTNLIKKREHL